MFLLFQPLTASAAKPIIDEEKTETQDKPGLVEKHLSKFVLNTANSLIAIMQAQDVSVLVFQREDVISDKETVFANKANATREKLTFGIFPSGLFDGVAKIYDIFNRLIPIPIFVLLAFGGLFIMFDMLRSAERTSKAKETLLGVIIGVLLIRFGHIAWEWIVAINYFIVDAVYVALKAGGIKVTSFIATVWDPSSTDVVMKSPSFVTALLVICALFMTFALNYQYMIRMIILAMLIALFPIVIISSVIPSRRSVLNTWFTQFTSQVMIQSAHAISLGLFFFALKNAEDLNFWLVLTMFFALPAMADIVQRLVGAFTGEGGGGGVGRSIANASGMSSLMAVGMMTRGLLQNKGSNKGENITKSSEVLPTGSTMSSDMTGSNNSVSSNGNEGVGPVPFSSGLNEISRPRGMAKVGSKIANAGKKMATNPQLGKLTRMAAVGGMATLGSMAGTMVTGNGSKGAMLGAGAGLTGVKVGETVKGKTGKGLQFGGEVFQSKAQGNNAFDLTRQRLGFHDKSQFSDPSEMRRMGEELLGGNSGASFGRTLGNMMYANDKIIQRSYEPSKDSYETVNQKRDIDWSIGQKEQEVAALKENQNHARKDLEYAVAKYGPTHEQTEKAKAKYNSANLNYLSGDKELRELRQKQSTFYSDKRVSRSNPANHNSNNNNREKHAAQQEQRRNTHLESIRRHATETNNLKNHVRSSGQP